MKLTKKQNDVLAYVRQHNPKITILSGAKRAGKTYIAILMFLAHIATYRNQGLSFIIGGATQASIKRNILNDAELILGKELKLDKSNAVEVFGNKVYCFDGANADSWKKARGFTSAGALLNEATALHDSFVKEVISRCSYKDSRIIMDTNPENPAHTVKIDYIDKDGQTLSNGRVNIKAFHFNLFDNNFLDDEYRESIIASTPSGMFTDRDIHGKWVSAQGVIYKDFTQALYTDNIPKCDKYIAGVDWGYEHYGSIVVVGIKKDKYYLVKEVAARHKEIDYWVSQAREIKKEFGNIDFYCDSARPEHVTRFKNEGFKAHNAKKQVVSGIEEVSKLFKQKRLLVNKNVDRFNTEIYQYVWNPITGEPVKLYDDVLDALRYAIYSHIKRKNVKTMNKNILGI